MAHPALALLEFESVAIGILAADAIVKRAPIALLKTGTIHPGHYLVLLAGSVASVTESYRAGLDAGGAFLLDQVLLPDVHPEVHDGCLGARRPLESDALGVLETRSVASLLRSADAAVKGAQVHIAEIRLADGLGGRAFVLFDGPVADVQTALEIGASRIPDDRLLTCAILPRLDGAVRMALNEGTRFAACAPLEPTGAEADESLGLGEEPAW
ncbi:MAG: BMC domain-containing protein [Candidatus Eisenbacteria bacterium]